VEVQLKELLTSTSAEQNAALLPLQCGPRPNFRNAKQKDVKLDEQLF
jgi:hypothetical protein